MVSPDQMDSLRESLNRAILDRLTEALLDCPSIDRLSNPVLRFEVFIQDGSDTATDEPPSSRELVISVSLFPHLCLGRTLSTIVMSPNLSRSN
jgi:hypothetical protein